MPAAMLHGPPADRDRPQAPGDSDLGPSRWPRLASASQALTESEPAGGPPAATGSGPAVTVPDSECRRSPAAGHGHRRRLCPSASQSDSPPGPGREVAEPSVAGPDQARHARHGQVTEARPGARLAAAGASGHLRVAGYSAPPTAGRGAGLAPPGGRGGRGAAATDSEPPP